MEPTCARLLTSHDSPPPTGTMPALPCRPHFSASYWTASGQDGALKGCGSWKIGGFQVHDMSERIRLRLGDRHGRGSGPGHSEGRAANNERDQDEREDGDPNTDGSCQGRSPRRRHRRSSRVRRKAGLARADCGQSDDPLRAERRNSAHLRVLGHSRAQHATLPASLTCLTLDPQWRGDTSRRICASSVTRRRGRPAAAPSPP